MFESWIKDARYAARRLRRRPLYTGLAVLTLALGAGGTAAIYSITQTLLLDPLPFVREDEIGRFWLHNSWTEAEFLHVRPEFAGFEKVGAYRPNDVTLEMPGTPTRLLPAIAVTAELFDVLGIRARLGRTFQSGDDLAASEPVVVLSHGEWQELGADPLIVGTRLQIGGLSHTVVGVMPPGFWFPTPATRAWTAARLSPNSGAGQYTLVGRVARGESMAHMEGPLRALAARLGAAFPYPNPLWDKRRNPAITPIREALVGDQRTGLLATLVAMAVILLIGCANVAALMLGQLDARAAETAVRAALGADRRRLVQQFGIEALMLGALAGLCGAGLAMFGFQLLLQSLSLGAVAEVAALDWTVLWASLAAGLAGSLLVAMVPTVVLWGGRALQPGLSTTRTGGVGARGGRLESGLVIAQVGLAVLLASGAGLLIRTVTNLQAISPGFEARAVVVIDAVVPSRFRTAERLQVISAALPVLESVPGVRSAGATQRLPLRGSGDNWRLVIQGRSNAESASTAFRMVSRDYFTTLGVPLRFGRDFDASDRAGSERVTLVNEALAAKFFPGENPIGHVLQTFDGPGERIVGVVGNVAESNLTDAPAPARYMLFEHLSFLYANVSFVLRTDSEAAAPVVIQAARAALARDVPQIAISQTTTMNNVFERAVGPAGRVVTLLSLLAGLALFLGAIGVYGVISHYVTRRARDYGISMALGQRPGAVVAEVMRRGALLIGTGITLGVAAALVFTRLFSSLLYEVDATDPVALAGAAMALALIGTLATFIPARRASLTDPARVLRQQ